MCSWEKEKKTSNLESHIKLEKSQHQLCVMPYSLHNLQWICLFCDLVLFHTFIILWPGKCISLSHCLVWNWPYAELHSLLIYHEKSFIYLCHHTLFIIPYLLTEKFTASVQLRLTEQPSSLVFRAERKMMIKSLLSEKELLFSFIFLSIF